MNGQNDAIRFPHKLAEFVEIAVDARNEDSGIRLRDTADSLNKAWDDMCRKMQNLPCNSELVVPEELMNESPKPESLSYPCTADFFRAFVRNKVNMALLVSSERGRRMKLRGFFR